MIKKLHTRFSFLLIPVFLFAAVTSCKKDKTEMNAEAPAATAEFTLKDSLKIEPIYATGQTADMYNRYNNKTYNVSSIAGVRFDVRKNGNDIQFYFVDSSIDKLVPAFTVTIKNTTYLSLQSQYSMTSTALIRVDDFQYFTNGSGAFQLQTPVISGVLKINYDAAFNTVSGEINNLKIPVGYYVPEDISSGLRSTNGIYITNGGSTRTVQLKFNYVKVK